MATGWFKMYRCLWENPVVCKDADHIAIWVYLLSSATHKDIDVYFNNERITLREGQFITGRQAIADKLKINESKVQRVLKLFENEGQIEQQTSSKNRLISICNWHKYQGDEQQANNKRTASEHKQEYKNNKNNIYGDFFEQIWKTYPKKKGKAQVKDKQKERLYLIGKEQIEKCIERYKQQIEKDHIAEQYIMYGSTFFNGGYVDYLDENYNEPKHKTLADTMKVF